MLKCATSLWSADLGNLVADMKRVEPYSDRFHLDVADGHYVKTMLFFPDLVKALRPHTRLPFEVHLIVTHPLDWIDAFTDAGADAFIFYLDSVREPREVIRAARALGRKVGISLKLDEPVESLDPYLVDLSVVTIVGTAIGIKGVSMDPSTPDRIRRAREIISRRGLSIEIEADGGIRRDTVPLLKAAGADVIVPGSLMFGGDPKALRAWLASL